MSGFNQFSLNIDALAHWALQTGLWVGVLLGLVLILRRPFARYFGAQATYALWAIPGLRLILPPLSIPQSWLPGVFRRDAVPFDHPPAAISSPPPDLVFPTDVMSIPIAPPAYDWTPVWLAVWLGGAALWIVWQLSAQWRFLRRLPAQTRPLSASLIPVAQSAAQITGLRRFPRIRLHTGGLGPCMTGLIRPIVLLPADFETRFSDNEALLALIHEFTHIRRADLTAALAALIFRAVNWPNPLVHVAAKRFRADQEAACDAAVLSRMGRDHQTATYARALLAAARAQTQAPLTLSAR